MENTLKDTEYQISELRRPYIMSLYCLESIFPIALYLPTVQNVKIKVTFYNVCDFVHVVCAIDVLGFSHPKHIARAT
jgi:hypothetical protein